MLNTYRSEGLPPIEESDVPTNQNEALDNAPNEPQTENDSNEQTWMQTETGQYDAPDEKTDVSDAGEEEEDYAGNETEVEEEYTDNQQQYAQAFEEFARTFAENPAGVVLQMMQAANLTPEQKRILLENAGVMEQQIEENYLPEGLTWDDDDLATAPDYFVRHYKPVIERLPQWTEQAAQIITQQNQIIAEMQKKLEQIEQTVSKKEKLAGKTPPKTITNKSAVPKPQESKQYDTFGDLWLQVLRDTQK